MGPPADCRILMPYYEGLLTIMASLVWPTLTRIGEDNINFATERFFAVSPDGSRLVFRGGVATAEEGG